MRNNLFLTFVFVLLLLFPFTVSAQTDSANIQESCQLLQAALLENNGKTAIKYVDKKTIHFYGNLLWKAKFYDSIQVENLPILEKSIVFMIRLKALKDKINDTSNNSFFIYATDHGLVDKIGITLGVSNIRLLKIQGDSATAQLTLNKIELPYFINFYKEANKWKINLTSLMSASSILLNQIAKNSNKSGTEYLLMIMEQATGKKYDPRIWKPIGN